MPPAGGLDGIRNNRRRPAALSLNLAKRAESTRRESFLELTTVTLNYNIQLQSTIHTLGQNDRDDSANQRLREVSGGTSRVVASVTQCQTGVKRKPCNPRINIEIDMSER